MIALDTNVLVRFLVEDDMVQAAKATALIEQAISDNATLFISDDAARPSLHAHIQTSAPALRSRAVHMHI